MDNSNSTPPTNNSDENDSGAGADGIPEEKLNFKKTLLRN